MPKSSALPVLATVESCTGCAACLAACQHHAITMTADREGFLRPSVAAAKCVRCHQCEHSCPVLRETRPSTSPQVFACRSKHLELREASSSGGIFPVLAQAHLAQHGVVYGCAWDDALHAVHQRIDRGDELARLQGSKYVQSNMAGTFTEAKADLMAGRQVLFSGTPCQIAGLRQFLQNNDDNLLTVEVLCHGVPSPGLLEKYRREVEQQSRRRLRSISFRDKAESWRDFSVTLKFDDGHVERARHYHNPYCRAFLLNYCLRPSCYQCRFREGRSGADLTLGDFWGIEHCHPQLDDNRGASVAFLHGAKGQMAWQAIAAQLDSLPSSIDCATRENLIYRSSMPCPEERRLFMTWFKSFTIKKLLKLCKKQPAWFTLLTTLRNLH